jgi:hypothetical protein
VPLSTTQLILGTTLALQAEWYSFTSAADAYFVLDVAGFF